MSANDLKRCPFCGGEGEMNIHNDTAYVLCKSCGGRSPRVIAAVEYCAIDKACELWNRRATNDKS